MAGLSEAMMACKSRTVEAPEGTRLNNKRLEKNTPVSVHDGDLIEFSKGVSGVKLLIIIPQAN